MQVRFALFVPASNASALTARVARGSAIIAPEDGCDAEQVTIDYEGAIYGQANVVTYADRARQAAGRCLSQYPTTARCTVARSDLWQVGWFDPQGGITLLDEPFVWEAVKFWLGVAVLGQLELAFSR